MESEQASGADAISIYREAVQTHRVHMDRAIAAEMANTIGPDQATMLRIVQQFREAVEPFEQAAVEQMKLQPPAPIMVPVKTGDAELVDAATEAAINAGCKVIQDALGVTSGDVGGIAFSGEAAREAFAERFRTYLALERLYADDA